MLEFHSECLSAFSHILSICWQCLMPGPGSLSDYITGNASLRADFFERRN